MSFIILEETVIQEDYTFDIPEHWYRKEPELWSWSPEFLGVIGICIDRHEEWADEEEAARLYQRSGVEDPKQIAYVPWHELDDDLIVECQSQVFSYNDVSQAEVGKLVLLNNGEVGKLVKAEFKLSTDQERIVTGRSGFPISFLSCILEVKTDEKHYKNVKDYDIRLIDETKALMPSIDMRNLQKKLRRAIHREKNKIVSLEEWKRKKGLIPSEEAENGTAD